jgi:glutamate-1-semialdehyde 2,1-aminomutase
MNSMLVPYALTAVVSTLGLRRLRARWLLSRAKHPSLAGHARISRRVARLVPRVEYDASCFFDSDGAPKEIAERRRGGFERLSTTLSQRFEKTTALTREATPLISDLQFTAAYRVPFQYSRYVHEHLRCGSFVQASNGNRVIDLDGNELIDLTGSYGVNVFGYDLYKECLSSALHETKDLGPVLGPYHPVIVDNVKRLCQISGLDEISFHMSGTEAVMQAVRLARYHTGRNNIVRFCGAYHGFWGDVQPGVGNPVTARETFTLSEMSERTLRVLRTRDDLACVLVNPLQALHPNVPASSDSALVDSSRSAHFDRAAYTRWLKELRTVCSERGIVLIFDEVFMGFRLSRGGAQQYFGVRADLVTYGKTLGGGLPIGVVCGRRALMRRYREDRPADICFARGTFNSHPMVMSAMNAFLRHLDGEQARRAYSRLDERWAARAHELNLRLGAARVPVRLENMSSVFTVLYPSPSRYNWMLQYYLRAEGIALSWVGTARLIFSIDFSDADFEEVCRRFVRAACAMQDDGFFFHPPGLTNQQIRRRILRELLSARLLGRHPAKMDGERPLLLPPAESSHGG